MKIDFEQTIHDLSGEPIKKSPKNTKPITLGEVVIEALLATTQSDASLSGEEKFKRFELALKCKGTTDLKVEEISSIKNRVGEVWSPLVVGRVWSILES